MEGASIDYLIYGANSIISMEGAEIAGVEAAE